MNLKNWKAVIAIAVGVALTFSVAWNAGASQDRRDYEIEGTWLVTVTQANCSTGAILSKFPSILTFAKGGTMAEDTTNPGFTPGERSAGQGFWRYEGKGTFYAKSIAFIHSPAAPPFKPGTQTIEQTIQFAYDNPEDWSSTASVQFADSNGLPYFPSPVKVCVTATAVRFQ